MGHIYDLRESLNKRGEEGEAIAKAILVKSVRDSGNELPPLATEFSADAPIPEGKDLRTIRSRVDDLSLSCGGTFQTAFMFPREKGFGPSRILVDDTEVLQHSEFQEIVGEMPDHEFALRALEFMAVEPKNEIQRALLLSGELELFQVRIQELVAAGSLPEAAARNLPHLEELDLSSPLIETGEPQENTVTLGEYSAFYHEASLFPWTTKEMVRVSAVHEYYHALAGKGVVLSAKANSGDFPGNFFKQGLSFGRFSDSGERTVSHFAWLDEAMTETLTRRHSSETAAASEAYKVECAILEKLFAKVDPALFIDAYFEHADPARDPKNPLPAWKRLKDECDKTFGRGFLRALDAQFNTLGKEAVLQQFEKPSSREKSWIAAQMRRFADFFS
ncbi:MAG: hypothetical protein KDD70_01075 [Bdellovibrionales bacterium]|nr:hypothetical protein [Bdellovibrionales bacterium]